MNRGVPQQQLDLLQFPAGGPTQLRAGPSQVMRGDPRNTSSDSAALE
jgi:hypothetical protein